MKKGLTRLWRTLAALTLSLAVAMSSLTAVAETWRGTIDQALGTTSVITTSGDKYTSDYETSQELVDAHIDLGERVAEEGAVLLKNDNNSLPVSSNRVTLFGMGSMYPFLGGTMGSTISGDDQIDLVSALEDRGFEVNPTMVDIYETLGSVVTGEEEGWTGTTPIYGNRPANFATPYDPSEPALETYTASEDAGGAGAEANYADSFAQYNDAAIVVISRPGAEGSDYYPGEEGIDEETYGTDSVLKLCENEWALLEQAKANFDNVIVLINSGSTMEIEDLEADDGITAIMFIGFPGTYGFLGIADLLNGDASPSGYLTDTYVVDASASPAAQNFGKIELTDTSAISASDSLMGELSAQSALGSFGGEASLAADHYLIEAEGIYTGYKYYETRYYDSVLGNGNASSATGASNGSSSWVYDDEVTYSFGYGLSYTTFEQTLNSVEADVDNQTITAEVTVTNTGSTAGKLAAQLYVQTPYTEYDVEHGVEKSAVDFLGMEKTQTLEPGASETLSISVDMKYMASWDSTAKDGDGGYILDGGEYYFALGTGAHEAVNNILAAQEAAAEGDAALTAAVTIGSDGEVDETTFAVSENGTEVVNQLEDADINYYQSDYATYLSRSDWEGTFPRTYDDLTIGGDKVDEWVVNLTNEVYQIDTSGSADTEGSSGSLTLSEMAGLELNDPLWGELIDQIPLGTLYAKIVKGGSTSDIIEEIQSPLVYQNDAPNGFNSTLSARGVNTDDENADYSIETMANEVLLASTFNKELLLEWGELLGNDGLWSNNIIIWGVAANLHRTPYNGRNYEYYSEDAMLSNYMAAATVEGALHYGIIVGPKHFAFNDQETQRSGIAVYMNEQKAREGDLRAFQGAFEDAGALGAMTAFNRIGATPVIGSTALLKNILREEWGFSGLLSTDMVNNTGYYRPEICIAAGVTMMADFSNNETMTEVAESWPYFTLDLVSQDEQLVSYAKENMTYQLYAYSQSAAQNISTESVTPWWETAMKGVIYGGYALTVAFLALYVVTIVRSRKKEE